MKVLVLNSGSSSQKTSLYELGASLPERALEPIWEGKLDWKDGQASLSARRGDGTTQSIAVEADGPAEATLQLMLLLTDGDTRAISSRAGIDVIGHRIVNGGAEHTVPEFVTSEVKAAIEKMCVFAPLHNRAGLDGIALAEKEFPSVRQVAVYDTGFHRTLPLFAATYPGPYEWLAQGIRRCGFHGINHQYVAERTAQMLQRAAKGLRIVSCHLGNGCSLAAIRDGESVDTTMGFTPLEGLMMGTRSGSIDPSIVTFLMREKKMSADEIDQTLNKKSGLLGVSGFSSDMRHIVEAMKQGNERAKLAFDIFVHRLQTGIAAMAASAGGIDALVFTAGIGENSAEVREAACAPLEFMGVRLDTRRNAIAHPDAEISAGDSAVQVLIVHAEEDWAIAKECWKLMR